MDRSIRRAGPLAVRSPRALAELVSVGAKTKVSDHFCCHLQQNEFALAFQQMHWRLPFQPRFHLRTEASYVAVARDISSNVRMGLLQKAFAVE